MSNRIATCVVCGEDRRHEGRGLCGRCWYQARKAGTLDDFPCHRQPAAELVEDYEFLRRQGYTRALAAERMGVTKKRLEKAIERHTRRVAAA